MTEAPYHIETSRLICRVNQWAGLYMTETSVMKELSYAKSITIAIRLEN